MHYAALARPAIDRVYVALRAHARERTREVVERSGVDPGFIVSFYWGFLARPMPAESFAAAAAYVAGADVAAQVEQGLVTVDEAGTITLTERGRAFALEFQQAIADSTRELWARTANLGTLPWPDRLGRLSDLLGRLLAAGEKTGGPAFHALSPPFEPEGASAELRITCRLGALRHHRADAHRAAWAGAGLTLQQLRELPGGDPLRVTIEAETNRLDEPVYSILGEDERWDFLALLASL